MRSWTNTFSWVVYLLTVACTCLVPVLGEKHVCYVIDEAQYLPLEPGYEDYMVNGSLCSHIIFSRTRIKGAAIDFLERNDKRWLNMIVASRSTYPSLKVLVELDIQDRDLANSARFTRVAQGIKKDVTDLGLQGISLQYKPASATKKQQFTDFCKTFQEIFNNTLVLALKADINASSYNVPELAKALDFIMLETYRFDECSGSEDINATIAAPLLNFVHPSAEEWVRSGVPKKDLVIGMATFGCYFRLSPVQRGGVPGSRVQRRENGRMTLYRGIIAYFEICMNYRLSSQSPERLSRNEPYFSSGEIWVGYEDTRSLKSKLNWLRTNGYGGWMVWNTHHDDYSGSHCRRGRYPLLTALNTPKESDIPTTISTTPETTPTSTKPTSPSTTKEHIPTSSTTIIESTSTTREGTTHSSTTTEQIRISSKIVNPTITATTKSKTTTATTEPTTTTRTTSTSTPRIKPTHTTNPHTTNSVTKSEPTTEKHIYHTLETRSSTTAKNIYQAGKATISSTTKQRNLASTITTVESASTTRELATPSSTTEQITSSSKIVNPTTTARTTTSKTTTEPTSTTRTISTSTPTIKPSAASITEVTSTAKKKKVPTATLR